MAATGFALAASQVASADALFSSSYGRILLLKLLLVAVAGVGGLLTAIRLRRTGRGRPPPVSGAVDRPTDAGEVLEIALRGPIAARRARRTRFTRATAFESCCLVLVLAAAAALSLSTAPRGPAFAPTVHTDQARLAEQLDDLLVALDFAPGTVGQNWARVTVDDTRRPAPAPITGVTLSMVGPQGEELPGRSLTQVDDTDGWRLEDVRFPTRRTWQAELTVHRLGRPDIVWTPQWTVGGGPLGVVQPLISDQPWAGHCSTRRRWYRARRPDHARRRTPAAPHHRTSGGHH